MSDGEIEILMRDRPAGVRATLNAHLDGIDRAFAIDLERMGDSVEDRLEGIERRLEVLEAGSGRRQ